VTPAGELGVSTYTKIIGADHEHAISTLLLPFFVASSDKGLRPSEGAVPADLVSHTPFQSLNSLSAVGLRSRFAEQTALFSCFLLVTSTNRFTKLGSAVPESSNVFLHAAWRDLSKPVPFQCADLKF
jgi:hypothetical protein